MQPMSAVLIIVAGLVNALASSVMKHATNLKNSPAPDLPRFWLLMFLAMAMYGGSFPLYVMGLSRSRLSAAQPVFSATSFLAITLASLLFFKETLVPLKAAGLAVILAGIAMVVA
jgi:multidrug transporter EmrE-like cation transporter